MRLMRWIATLCAGGAMALLAGCGGSGNEQAAPQAPQAGNASAPVAKPAGKTVLEFWHYFGGDHERALKKLIADFQAENPDVEVKPLFQGRPQELLQKLQNSFATTPSKNPVLSTVYESWTTDFHQKGYMEAVEDHFAGPDGLSKAEQEDIIKVFRETNSYNGKMVTMPFNKSIYVLYMNTDRMAAAGITTAPRTLEEFGDAIKKLTKTDAGPKTYGMGMMPASEAFTSLFYASGGEFFGKDGKPTFNTPDGQAIMRFWRDLQFPTKHLYVTTDYMDAPFGNQQIAMFIYSSASFPYNAKSVAGRFKWDVAPIPGIAGRTPRYVMQGTNIGLFKNRPDAEKQAAWKLVKFLTNTKNSVFWQTKTGYMPIRYSAVKDAEMQKYLAANPMYARASALVTADLGKQEPTIREWDGIRQEIGIMVDRVLNKGGDSTAELTDLEKKVADRLAKGAGPGTPPKK